MKNQIYGFKRMHFGRQLFGMNAQGNIIIFKQNASSINCRLGNKKVFFVKILMND